MTPVEFVFAIAMRYELEQLERIDRQISSRVLAFPGATAVDRQQELAEWPVLAVYPVGVEPWIGVFHGGGYGVPPAPPGQVIGWTDGKSLCVLKTGGGSLVRADDPAVTGEIESFPITNVLAIPEQGLIVFANFTDIVAYNADGIAWRSGRLALDELDIIRAEGDVLRVAVVVALRLEEPEIVEGADLGGELVLDQPAFGVTLDQPLGAQVVSVVRSRVVGRGRSL
jgi:hypothetical protein